MGNAPTTGDEAIAIGLILLIRKIWKDKGITIFTPDPGQYRSIQKWAQCSIATDQCVPQLKSNVWTTRIASLGFILGFPLFQSKHPIFQLAMTYSRISRVLFLQGGPEWSLPNLIRIRHLLHRYILLRSLRIQGVYLYSIGQAFGPIPKKSILKFLASKFLLRRCLRCLTLVAPRDALSSELVSQLAKPSNNCIAGCDTALLLSQKVLPKSLIQSHYKLKHRSHAVVKIGLSTRDFQDHYNCAKHRKRYIEEFAILVDEISDLGYKICWIPTDSHHHNERLNDLEMIATIIESCRSYSPSVDDLPKDSLDPDEIIQVAMGLDALISTRLHPIILASIVGTPAISLAYDSKCLRYMDSIGMGDYTSNIEDFSTGKVKDLLHRLLKEREQRSSAILQYTTGAAESLSARVIDIITTQLSCP